MPTSCRCGMLIRVMILIGALLPGPGFSGDFQDPGPKFEIEDFQKIRLPIEYLADNLTGDFARLQDIRVSPFVRAESWLEVPMEFGILTTEANLVPVLTSLDKFSDKDLSIILSALTVSTSSESTRDGFPLLNLTLMIRVITGKSFPAESRIRANSNLIEGLVSLAKTTTFTPQVMKHISKPPGKAGNKEEKGPDLGGGIVEGTLGQWITNLRIDSDHRVQMSGYAVKDLKLVTALGDTLAKTGVFNDVFMGMVNRNTFEKVPVWRFDFTFRIK